MNIATTALLPEMECEITFDLVGGEDSEELDRVAGRYLDALDGSEGEGELECANGHGASGDGIHCGKWC